MQKVAFTEQEKSKVDAIFYATKKVKTIFENILTTLSICYIMKASE